MKIESSFFWSIVVVACSVSMTGCTPPAKTVRSITKLDVEQEQVLQVGDSLKISLGQCVGCADSWKVLDADTLVEVRDDGVVSHCKDCVGGTGDALFMLRAKYPGQAKVLFQYFGDTAVFRFRVND